MVSYPGGTPIMDVERVNDVLILEVFDGISMNTFGRSNTPGEMVMTIIDGNCVIKAMNF